MKRAVNFLKKNWVILLIIVILILLFSYSYFSKGVVYSISKSDNESVVNFIDSFGIFSYFMFILIVILEVVLAPIPALALYVAGGALFGTFLGGTLTLIGNLIGAYIAFWIARRFGRKFVEKRVDEKMRKRFDKFSEKYGGFSLFLLRINPFTTSDLFSYLAGLTKMKVKTFILGTGLGLIPMIFVQAYFGQAFVKSHPMIYSVLLWISVAYLLIFVYLIWRAASMKKRVVTDKNVNSPSP
ncbi:MAG: TVP38/TMEM64 family protein [Candidatus Pacearchaeota archaeon]|nr:TVP38/TMEM64 family protein [Candidatus Pacearchaeota archaeon]